MTDISLPDFKSSFLNALRDRGYINQCTDFDGLDEKLSAGSISAYIGFDCTAPSLHVGSLVPIMMLRRLQQAGHRPIVLMGGGTTRIGDPSGKDTSRQLLDDTAIEANMRGIASIFDRFLDKEDPKTGYVMVNNADWLGELGYINFLRDIGPHFTINRMLTFDSVKLRLDREQPLTFLEFNYMILQAYDFQKLANTHDCVLQMGGSDQWGNIVNGMELGRRIDGHQLFGLTTHLMTTADGKKMGKTESGAVWLSENQLSDYDYWQFWRNTQDADVGRFLRLFTDISLDEIAELEKLKGQDINAAKIRLADAATAMCRGEEAARRAKNTAEETFARGGAGADLPTIDIAPEQIGIPLLDIYVSAGLADSKSAARRLMKQGGARLNDMAIQDDTRTLTADDFTDDQAKLSAGKKKHAILKLV